jgi:hypothetical protein
MKRLLVVIGLLVQVALSNAAVTVVDFAAAPGLSPAVDITAGNTPGTYSLSGMTFTYDSLGSGFTSTIDNTGIFGGTAGLLKFDFSTPATALSFNFTLSNGGTLGTAGNPVDPVGLDISFTLGGVSLGASTLVPATINLTGDAAIGTVSFTGPASGFDHADLFFSSGAPSSVLFFQTDSSITYTTVPEPATGALLVSLGLCGFAGWRRFRRPGC